MKTSATRVKICRRDVAMENHALKTSLVAGVERAVAKAVATLQTVVIPTTVAVRASTLRRTSTSTFTTAEAEGPFPTGGTRIQDELLCFLAI